MITAGQSASAPTFLASVDNMVQGRDQAGYVSWPGLRYTNPRSVTVSYTLPSFANATTPSKVCASCWANSSTNFWARSTSLPGTPAAGTTAVLNDSLGTSGSWLNGTIPWSWTMYLFDRTGISPISIGSTQVNYIAAGVWQNPGGTSDPVANISPWLAALVFVMCVGFLILIIYDQFRRTFLD